MPATKRQGLSYWMSSERDERVDVLCAIKRSLGVISVMAAEPWLCPRSPGKHRPYPVDLRNSSHNLPATDARSSTRRCNPYQTNCLFLLPIFLARRCPDSNLAIYNRTSSSVCFRSSMSTINTETLLDEAPAERSSWTRH